ncbi:MAG: hypothetical protein A2020_14530 [Lentisphaerae bacterium GWF2_45_14]|nr:MAG: hypothetical protein A2020_14530 [Lentisphaerae bacterium GWF2_45_14]
MQIDWNNLGFSFMPVKSHIRFRYKDGAWDTGKLYNDFNISLSVAAVCLHYGQACFEGLKAFRHKDGTLKIFRPWENIKRLNRTLDHIVAPEIPHELFLDGLLRVIKDNIEYVPPYESEGSFYIRPLVIGTSPQIGIAPSREYELIILVMPVGPYYKGGIKPVTAYIMEDYDRAAPGGTGHVKVAGNYAAGLKAKSIAHGKGAEVDLFLDPTSHQYIDEFGTSNFIAITKDGRYVTPESKSILPSITNLSLMKIAEDLGMKVEKRKIHRDELPEFAEVGACGTAVVITPVGKIMSESGLIDYGVSEIGPCLKKLYERMTGIQRGDCEDKHKWLLEVK